MQPIPLPVVVFGDNGLQDAITRAGSKSSLARMLGITRAAVSHWTKLPGGRLYQLKVIRPEWFAKTREKV